MTDFYAALLIVIAAAVLAFVGVRTLAHRRRAARRARLAAAPTDPALRAALARAVPRFAGMPAALRRGLESRVRVFLDEKRFVGCAGLEVSDAMRTTIAANACLLALGRDGAPFPGVRSILVYPTAFLAEQAWQDDDEWLEHEATEIRAGEAWEGGPLILAWDEVRADRAHGDGCNVILHEFAHKLDEENPAGPGLPPLPAEAIADWSRVMGAEFAALAAAADAGRTTVIDPYGAESPAEFFAVVTELFFENPRALRRAHAELYALFTRCFGVDPVTWTR